jgi:hypothetical protein
MPFPQVSATNLQGRRFTLPADLAGERNLLLIAFWQEQQRDIDTWLPFVKRLVQEQPGLAYYELPTIDRSNPAFRWWLDTVMRLGIPDRQARATTITLYLNKQAFRRELGLKSEDRIYILLVDRQGEILWRSEGMYSEEQGAALRRRLAEEQRPPDVDESSLP